MPRHVPVQQAMSHPMHRRIGEHENAFDYMSRHSTFYTNVPPIEALHTFLRQEGSSLRLYGVDRALYAENDVTRGWGRHELVTWNLYIDLLLRVCRTHHRIENILDGFDLTAALAATSQRLFARIQAMIRMRMFLGVSRPPFYRRVCAVEPLSWRHQTYDTDACAPWKLPSDLPCPTSPLLSSPPPPPSPPTPPPPDLHGHE